MTFESKAAEAVGTGLGKKRIDHSMETWAMRGLFLFSQLRERTVPPKSHSDRAVLEIDAGMCDVPITLKADGTVEDYIAAVDAAMQAAQERGVY